MRFEVIDDGCLDSGRSNRSGCAVAEIQSPYHQSSDTACAMKLEKNGTKIDEQQTFGSGSRRGMLIP